MKTKTQSSLLLKSTLCTLGSLFLAASLSGQTALTQEEAQHYASLTRQKPQALDTLPLRIKPDLAHPIGAYEEDYGGLFIPDANFSLELLQQAKTDPVPVGELWFRNLAPMKDGWAVSERELHLVEVSDNYEHFKVPCCPVALRKNDQGSLELLVYGNGKQPLLTLPLKTTHLASTKPVTLLAEREDQSGLVTMRLFGQYQAQFHVTELIPW